jgi:peptidoglycan-associated lipoprotein
MYSIRKTTPSRPMSILARALSLAPALSFALTLAFAFSGCSSTTSSDTGADAGLSESALNADREARFGEGGIPTAESGGIFRDISFDFDSSSLNSSGRQNAEFNAEVLRENSDVKVVLEGHADERGTAEYNLALGAERARAVKEVLTSLGIPASRLETVSYGEEVPLDSGHDESAWAQNRRVHFSGYSEKTKR